MNITELLTLSVNNHASDLHLSAGLPPVIRVDGEMRRLSVPEMDHKQVNSLIYEVMNERQRREYEDRMETDFAIEVPGVSRFRVNAFVQNRGAAAVLRVIPAQIPTLSDLQAPAAVSDIIAQTSGMILVTGATGSGKSTTLAAMIDHINNTRRAHILTVEDPIEFVHQSKLSVINQREVHRHTRSFSAALRSALREDPDVILVGELRDLETIRLAITAAETGHLVLATTHTNSAPKTLDRLIDVFPGAEQGMVRSMLSESMRAVVSQTLLKRVGGGRVAVHEVMLATPAIRNMIREDKVAQMYSAIQTGQQYGMQTMEQCLRRLVAQGLVAAEDAAAHLGTEKTSQLP